MGLLDYFKRGDNAPGALGVTINLPIKSPWLEDRQGDLKTVLYSNIMGQEPEAFPLSRAEALTIPAVSKAKGLLTSAIARLPLVVFDKNGPLAKQPTWAYRTSSAVSPYERTAAIVDDLIFYGYSLLYVTRGADGLPLDMEWVPMRNWKFTKTGIAINDKEVHPSEFCLINSPFDGLLTVGARKLREARDVETQIAQKVGSPIPLTVISATDDTDRAPAEIQSMLDGYKRQRKDPSGAVAYAPFGMKVEALGTQDPALFLEERNAIVTNIGQFLNVRSAMLDGTSSIDSLTYTTGEGQKNAFYEFDLPTWTDPITARLSQDGEYPIVPRGQWVRFDLTSFYAASLPTGPVPNTEG